MNMIDASRVHLAETGMTWWQHFKHVQYMAWTMIKAITYGIPHGFVPSWYPGVSRDLLFKDMLEHQLETRPDLLSTRKLATLEKG